MITINIIPYNIEHRHTALADFEEMLHRSALQYSMMQLISEGITTKEDFMEAFHKTLLICSYAGINPTEHFSQVYTYDPRSGEMDIDWLISKKGLTLMILQYPKH